MFCVKRKKHPVGGVSLEHRLFLLPFRQGSPEPGPTLFIGVLKRRCGVQIKGEGWPGQGQTAGRFRLTEQEALAVLAGTESNSKRHLDASCL